MTGVRSLPPQTENPRYGPGMGDSSLILRRSRSLTATHWRERVCGRKRPGPSENQVRGTQMGSWGLLMSAINLSQLWTILIDTWDRFVPFWHKVLLGSNRLCNSCSHAS